MRRANTAWARSRSPSLRRGSITHKHECCRVPALSSAVQAVHDQRAVYSAQATLLAAQTATTATVLLERRKTTAAAEVGRREIAGTAIRARCRWAVSSRRGRRTRTEAGSSWSGASRTWCTRRRLVIGVVHTQAASPEVDAVESANGVGGHGCVREFGEGEAARLPRHPVHAQAHSHPGIDFDEQRAQLVLGGLETKIANKDRGRNGTPPQDTECVDTIAVEPRARETPPVKQAPGRSECWPSAFPRGRSRPHRYAASIRAGGRDIRA